MHTDGRYTVTADAIGYPAQRTGRMLPAAALVDDDATEIRLYDMIGGFFGITSADFADTLDTVETTDVVLRIDSPGGSVFDGIAIYNRLADWDGHVHVIVDGLAASAASFIAMAGDTITMNRGAEMMIHDARGGMFGTAPELRQFADTVDRQTVKIANFYQARAGGDLTEWLSAMAAETWYDADEAVTAGLADEAIDLTRPDDDADSDSDTAAAENMLRDSLRAALLADYRYPGRDSAPDPFAARNDAGAPTPTAPMVDADVARLRAAFPPLTTMEQT
jgi:ATP-dependent protease ClpP protease subunit